MGSCAVPFELDTSGLNKMKSLFILFLTLACVSGQFFNPFNFRRPNRPNRPNNTPPPRPFNSAPAQSSGGGNGVSCNQGFHVSRQKFDFNGAQNYCRSVGLRGSSLENSRKIGVAYNLVRPLKYFWTGGRVNHGRGTVSWPNGFSSTPDWSPTGGRRQPQPDNREGNEFCVAILNNFYGDGIKFHDVSCHHTKPALCEC